jgi:hypothetical protein
MFSLDLNIDLPSLSDSMVYSLNVHMTLDVQEMHPFLSATRPSLLLSPTFLLIIPTQS